MPEKRTARVVVDLGMTVLLLLLMAYSFIGEEAHEWLGAAMLLLFVLHHIWNFTWCRNLAKGRYTPFRVVQTVVAGLLLVTMVGSMASGIVLSRYAFGFLPPHGGQALARAIHLPCAYWGFGLMSLHLGLHWNMVLGMVRQRMGRKPGRAWTWVLRLLAMAVALYGAACFCHNDIASYLLMRTHFVFYDFGQPLALFFAEYLAIMGLFVCIAYYLGKACIQSRNRAKEKKEGNS